MWKRITAGIISSFLLWPIAAFANSEIYVGGDSVGIAVQYDGVMISGTYGIDHDGKTFDPAKQGFQKGDMITAVNGVKITDLEMLYQELTKFRKAVNEAPVTVVRNQKQLDLNLTTIFDENTQSFKCGLYVKDEITGVGTMTFYNPENQKFGALGHEIMDQDLQKIAEIKDGKIYESKVDSITKAQPNTAGEKNATIDYDTSLGSISKNTNIGIYGKYDALPKRLKAYEWANKDEVHIGKATIETVISGQNVKSYDIEITKVNPQNHKDIKGIEFKVTDDELLSSTNGIVQGMSGSPIIQDEKIIGAVTHVVTSNPVNGYGVYIEWMLNEASN